MPYQAKAVSLFINWYKQHTERTPTSTPNYVFYLADTWVWPVPDPKTFFSAFLCNSSHYSLFKPSFLMTLHAPPPSQKDMWAYSSSICCLMLRLNWILLFSDVFLYLKHRSFHGPNSYKTESSSFRYLACLLETPKWVQLSLWLFSRTQN